MINMVAPWPTVYSKKGWGYLPRYFQEKKSPQEKFRFEVPRNFDWPKAWADFTATMKEATAIARAAGLKFSLENHTHTFVPRADAFLRLWDAVRDDALGFNADIGWIQLEREYPVVTIYKAREHILNVHLRDIDAPGLRFVAPGDGCMDFEGVVAALHDIGFAGFLTFEQDGVPDMKAAMRRGKEILEEILAKNA
jgi:sugar phosphate isomerase/epimerase